ncbi:hypothetical protein [Nostoc sp.]|uniref:hypothetical protein n=1 Tax=Nostoc sp. TaxID=1180 RepID=UPI002FF7EA57
MAVSDKERRYSRSLVSIAWDQLDAIDADFHLLDEAVLYRTYVVEFYANNSRKERFSRWGNSSIIPTSGKIENLKFRHDKIK